MTTAPVRHGRISILVLNPNSSASMTAGMARAIRSMPPNPFLDATTYTAPSPSPTSIDNDAGLQLSHQTVASHLSSTGLLDGDDYDGVLVTCYSEHGLVKQLAAQHKKRRLCVMGIFEASVLTALSLVSPPFGDSEYELGGYWGIVTTGSFWDRHISDALAKFLGVQAAETSASGADAGSDVVAEEGLAQKSKKFAGVFSTGLNAVDFHSGAVSEHNIRQRMRGATKRLLLSERISVVVLGCGGMTGLEDIVRETAEEAYGQAYGARLCVVDAVKAGVVMLEAMIKSRNMFTREYW